MLSRLNKYFAMIKQKSKNKRMEQSTYEKGHTIIAQKKNLSQGMNDTK